MDKVINKNFHDICKKDVDEITNKIKKVLPNFIEDWCLTKSYYRDEEILVISSPIIDEYSDKIGHSIGIVDHKDSTSYRLEYREEADFISLELETQYNDNNDLVVKREGVVLEDTSITRSFYYESDKKASYYDIGYDLAVSGDYQEYLKSESLDVVLESIKPSKTRKRN